MAMTSSSPSGSVGLSESDLGIGNWNAVDGVNINATNDAHTNDSDDQDPDTMLGDVLMDEIPTPKMLVASTSGDLT